MTLKQSWNKFSAFLKEDSWSSLLVWLIILAIFIKLIFFPSISLIVGSSLPLVIVESCSMYHESSFDDWWDEYRSWYSINEITKSDFESFHLKNGLNKGDVIMVWGHSEYKQGDIIIFKTDPEFNIPRPIIHRVVFNSSNKYSTKGDNGITNNAQAPFEKNIEEDKIIGKAVGKIPFIGWLKLIFFESSRNTQSKGTCYSQINDRITGNSILTE